MSKKIKSIISLAALSLLFASCGEQHKAQGLVEDFLDANLAEGNSYKVERFSKIARTAMVDQKTVDGLRQEMKSVATFRKNVQYGAAAVTDTLAYVRATYKLSVPGGKETEYVQTFYMDKGLTGIVAFKQN